MVSASSQHIQRGRALRGSSASISSPPETLWIDLVKDWRIALVDGRGAERAAQVIWHKSIIPGVVDLDETTDEAAAVQGELARILQAVLVGAQEMKQHVVLSDLPHQTRQITLRMPIHVHGQAYGVLAQVAHVVVLLYQLCSL